MSNALFIQNLHKVFPNGVAALRGIDLTVTEGDFFGLLGPNGAGKSTAIGILCSLINKCAGQVEIFNYNTETHHSQAKRLLGLVPQEFNFNMWEPVLEIVVNQAGYYGIAPRPAYTRAEQLLDQLGLWDRRHSQARELSGGMKRRLMIARALVHQPRLLILDEPTAGVDIELRRSTWNYLREINAAGTTIILTTHYLEEAESLCRNLAIINHGKIIENTDVKTLLNKLSTEYFLLDLAKPIDSPPDLTDFNISLPDTNTLEVAVTKQQHLNDLFCQLEEHDIHVLSMRNKSNRLEEMFVRLIEEEPIESRS